MFVAHTTAFGHTLSLRAVFDGGPGGLTPLATSRFHFLAKTSIFMYNYTPLTNLATSIVARSVIAGRNSDLPSENLTNTTLHTLQCETEATFKLKLNRRTQFSYHYHQIQNQY